MGHPPSLAPDLRGHRGMPDLKAKISVLWAPVETEANTEGAQAKGAAVDTVVTQSHHPRRCAVQSRKTGSCHPEAHPAMVGKCCLPPLPASHPPGNALSCVPGLRLSPSPPSLPVCRVGPVYHHHLPHPPPNPSLSSQNRPHACQNGPIVSRPP